MDVATPADVRQRLRRALPVRVQSDVRYLLQGARGGSCCTVVTALNALRYFGLKTIRIGTPEWDRLVDSAGCLHGSVIGDEWMAELGLRRRPIRVGYRTIAKNLPVMLDVLNPHVGTSLHSVLVVGAHKLPATGSTAFDIVNYRWLRGPVVERIRWDDIPLMPPGNINRRAWRVERIS